MQLRLLIGPAAGLLVYVLLTRPWQSRPEIGPVPKNDPKKKS